MVVGPRLAGELDRGGSELKFEPGSETDEADEPDGALSAPVIIFNN